MSSDYRIELDESKETDNPGLTILDENGNVIHVSTTWEATAGYLAFALMETRQLRAENAATRKERDEAARERERLRLQLTEEEHRADTLRDRLADLERVAEAARPIADSEPELAADRKSCGLHLIEAHLIGDLRAALDATPKQEATDDPRS